MQLKWQPYYRIILAVLCILFYFPFLGDVHLFDWDEINFAESAREMMVTGEYFKVMIDYQPFWEKPPFFFWLQVLSMKIFGVNEFAARFPNALFGLITILTIYHFGSKWVGKSFGFIWGFLFLISLLPFFYFKSGIIDPVFNYFIFLSMLLILQAIQQGKKGQLGILFLAGMVNGLAILTKGPVGFLLILLTFLVIWIVARFRKILSPGQILLFVAGAFITSSLWYLPELIMNGPWFIKEFMMYQIELFAKPVAGHQQPFFYHALVVFIGCFPISILALPTFSKRFLHQNKTTDGNDIFSSQVNHYRRWNIVLLLVVLILFSIVKTKIVHYSSMTYLPLSFLAALYVYKNVSRQTHLHRWVMICIGVMGIIFSLIMISVPMAAMNKEIILPYINDPFAKASFMQDVSWLGIEWVIGLFFLGGLLIFLVFASRKNLWKGLILYGITTLVVLTVYLKLVVPKIERYSQGGIIEFYQSIKGQDVYIIPVSFKTYAHYFYFEQPPYPNIPVGKERQEWATRGRVDKPVYIVVKNTEQYVKELPDVTFVKQIGGYLIFRREAIDF